MQGYFAWEGVGWYRKEFTLSKISGKEVLIYFGGAYRNSTVYVNGKEAGGRAYGYSSFELNISDLVREGKNLIAVRLDNGCEAPDRWYSGAGLYRNVYLKIVPAVHIKTWGVQVQAKLQADKQSSASHAQVTLHTVIQSRGKTGSGQVRLRVQGPDGAVAAIGSVPFNLSGKAEVVVRQNVSIQSPALWSAETPALYRAFVQLDTEPQASAGPLPPDQQTVEVHFGIRDIKIAYRKGMTVNGKSVKLKGVCLHHESGIAGAAYYNSVWRRRLLNLKSIGCNAIRTSHNPPADEFLDLCDELGFYVIDECFDKWKSGYYAAHFEKDAERDLTEFILRDRNHPSVFLWSVGNEVEGQGSDAMLKIQKSLVSVIRKLDDRPVTCALQPHVHPKSLIGAPAAELVKVTQKLAEDVDVLGLNYHEPLYRDYTAGVKKPIVGTECYDYYSSDALNYEDINFKNPWQFVLENDNVIGQFIWAGIDYLGECVWPVKAWVGAILDICGFMKPNSFFRKSIWSSEPMIYIGFYDQNKKSAFCRGRWSFPLVSSQLNLDHLKKQTVTAVIYTNCDEAELWINGKKLGYRKRRDFANGIIEWPFEYASGEIKVIGRRDGKELCSHVLKTAGPAVNVQLLPDVKHIECGSVAHVEVNITDKNGILCPNQEALVEFSLSGDGEILGACSSDLNSNFGFTQPKVITSEGKALVMIRAGESSGTLELCAYSEKLKPACVKFKQIPA